MFLSTFSSRILRFVLPAMALMLPSLCLAHSGQDGQGFVAGFLHPLLGFDHLLAMVGVGIVSAQLGGANIWRVPLGFVLAMVVGGVIGIYQIPLPHGELGVAASVVLLGIAIIRVRASSRIWAPLVFVALFGICHGHAHGLEMPESASPAFFTLGFLLSTSMLHLTGVLIGEVSIRNERLVSSLRYTGAAMAGMGLTFLLTGFGVAVI
jgi:urease accessory protein